MKICIYGGSFNPPHKMHKKVAEKLLKEGLADKVIVVPTGNAYKKPDLVDFSHRINMLSAMFKGIARVEVSDFEGKPTQVFTYQTLDHFKALYPSDEIYIALGSDNMKEISSWKNADYLVKTYNFIVFMRNKDNKEEILKIAKGAKIVFASEVGMLSSTDIRNAIKQKQDVSSLVDKNVLQYIQENKLYGE